MKVVGVTGGIGSGKSTVCKIFSLLGVPLYNADLEAKKLYEESAVKKKVVELFGKQVLQKGGSVDKVKLSEIIFNDPKALKNVNGIIHPALRKKFLAWKKKHTNEKYVIKEAAIMIESGAIKDVDFLISVNSPEQLRLERALQRDNTSKEQIFKRIKEQLNDKARNKYADAIIYNDDKHSLIEQVLALHKKIGKLSV